MKQKAGKRSVGEWNDYPKHKQLHNAFVVSRPVYLELQVNTGGKRKHFGKSRNILPQRVDLATTPN